MHAFVSRVVRRGLDAQEKFEVEIPTWGMAMLGFTLICFLFSMYSTGYTYGRLVPTLIMVENTEAVLFEQLPADDMSSKDKTDVEIVCIKQKPITASFRSTIRHLRARAGCLSRYRGLAMYIAQKWSAAVATGFFLRMPYLYFASPVIAAVLTASLSAGWTHIVMSEPSSKRWFQRIPSFKTWKVIAGPTAILSIAEQLAVCIPVTLISYIGQQYDSVPLDEMSNCARVSMAIKCAATGLLMIVLVLVLVLPANVALTRIQASHLPEEEDTIVPFDRTFGEHVDAIFGLKFRDAWATFDGAARIRLIKAYMKLAAIQIALIVFFTLSAMVQLYVILGDDLQKVIDQGRAETGL